MFASLHMSIIQSELERACNWGMDLQAQHCARGLKECVIQQGARRWASGWM